jgi:Zn-dependent protease with chaperone function
MSSGLSNHRVFKAWLAAVRRNIAFAADLLLYILILQYWLYFVAVLFLLLSISGLFITPSTNTDTSEVSTLIYGLIYSIGSAICALLFLGFIKRSFKRLKSIEQDLVNSSIQGMTLVSKVKLEILELLPEINNLCQYTSSPLNHVNVYLDCSTSAIGASTINNTSNNFDYVSIDLLLTPGWIHLWMVDRQSARAILAHEFAHIINGDQWIWLRGEALARYAKELTGYRAYLYSPFAFMAFFTALTQLLPQTTGIVYALVLSVAAGFLVGWGEFRARVRSLQGVVAGARRHSEFAADLFASLIISKSAMIGALAALEPAVRGKQRKKRVTDWLHPPVARRITFLKDRWEETNPICIKPDFRLRKQLREVTNRLCLSTIFLPYIVLIAILLFVGLLCTILVFINEDTLTSQPILISIGLVAVIVLLTLLYFALRRPYERSLIKRMQLR